MRLALELKAEGVEVAMVVAEAADIPAAEADAGGTDEAKRAVAMNVDEVIKKYASEQMSSYRLLSEKTKERLSSILSSRGIVPHSITSREKDPEKLREKIAAEGDAYDNILDDIKDLAGVRIITYFPSDVDKIVPLIEKEFRVDPKHSMDRRLRSDPSIFGYASVHFVVEFRPKMLKLPEYALFNKMKCEIQVRTILQHAWAEIEHNVVYKAPEDIPFRLRRRFASLAGLLEIADREFESLRRDGIAVRQAIQSRIRKAKKNEASRAID
jgi:putative GTP pyrophosphokinase